MRMLRKRITYDNYVIREVCRTLSPKKISEPLEKALPTLFHASNGGGGVEGSRKGSSMR